MEDDNIWIAISKDKEVVDEIIYYNTKPSPQTQTLLKRLASCWVIQNAV